MNRDRMLALLQDLERGAIDSNTALEQLARFPFVDTPHARVDTQRGLRQGLPEVVFGPGKTPSQIVEVVRALVDADERVLVTRVEPEVAEAVAEELPGGEYHAQSRLLWFGPAEVELVGKGTIVASRNSSPTASPMTSSRFSRGSPVWW